MSADVRIPAEDAALSNDKGSAVTATSVPGSRSCNMTNCGGRCGICTSSAGRSACPVEDVSPRLDEIAARLGGISPFPWMRGERGVHPPTLVYCDDSLGSAVAQTRLTQTLAVTDSQAERNALFIANAPEDIAWLVDQVRALTRRLRPSVEGGE